MLILNDANELIPPFLNMLIPFSTKSVPVCILQFKIASEVKKKKINCWKIWTLNKLRITGKDKQTKTNRLLQVPAENYAVHRSRQDCCLGIWVRWLLSRYDFGQRPSKHVQVRVVRGSYNGLDILR